MQTELVSVLDSSDLYDTYEATIHMTSKLCGGIPKNPAMIADWIKARTGFDDEKTADQIADMEAHVDEQAEKSWIGFYRDERGICLECRGVKAMFKECASVLRITEQKRGCKQIFQHGFEVKAVDGGNVIPLGLAEPHGWFEAVCHSMTPKGPRSSLKRVDYVEDINVHFRVLVLKTALQETRHIGEAEIRRILAFAQENGVGADRSQGRGKFVVTRFDVGAANGKVAKEESSGEEVPAKPTRRKAS
jgi:hypothetical protein